MGYIGSCFEKLEGWLGAFSAEVFESVLPAAWIEEALQATGRANERERKLTAPFVVWLVIALGLYRNLSIRNVVRRLGMVMRVGSLWWRGEAPASSSVVEARDRLGTGPLRWLGDRLRGWILDTYRDAMSWKGWRVLAIDGTTLKVPDSAENRRRFGRPGASQGQSAFPQMRALFLVSTRLRLIVQAVFAPYHRGEFRLALRMLPTIPEESLVLADRNFNGWEFLLGLLARRSHFLVRIRRSMRGRLISVLGRGDRLVQVKLPAPLRQRRPDLPRKVIVRELTVRLKHGRWYRYWTSLHDPGAYPAAELVQLYTQRWEEETLLDEIKTHQAGATRVNRPVIFRSTASRRVLQEAYGLILAYNLVRLLMARAAAQAQVDPLRLSFVDSLERIRQAALLMAAAPQARLGAIYQDLITSISLCLLPRRKRSNPREVCIKVSPYKTKRKAA